MAVGGDNQNKIALLAQPQIRVNAFVATPVPSMRPTKRSIGPGAQYFRTQLVENGAGNAGDVAELRRNSRIIAAKLEHLRLQRLPAEPKSLFAPGRLCHHQYVR